MNPNESLDHDLIEKPDFSEAQLRALKILGVSTFALLIFGFVFKILHWPGADILLLLSVAMVVISSIYRFKVNPRKDGVAKFGFVSSILMATWLLFYLFRWPFETYLFYLALISVIIRSILLRRQKD